jgi:hypothetical protein
MGAAGVLQCAFVQSNVNRLRCRQQMFNLQCRWAIERKIMWRTIRACVVVALATSGVRAFAADSYMCHPPSGSTITAPFPPPECAYVEIHVLGPSGAEKDVIPPLETAAQRRDRENAEKLAAQEAERSARQQNLDRALRERYKNLDAIESDRRRALEESNKNLSGAIALLTKYAMDRIKLDKEVEEYYRPPHHIPPKIVHAYQINDEKTSDMEKFKLSIQAQIKDINNQFNDKKKRFEELDRADQLAREAHKGDFARH